MTSVASSPSSIKQPLRQRTGVIIYAAKDFIDARWHIAEARGALAKVMAMPIEGRRDAERKRVAIYADEALQRFERAEAEAPGLRRRCARELAELEALVAQAAPRGGAAVAPVVDLAQVRARRAASRTATIGSP